MFWWMALAVAFVAAFLAGDLIMAMLGHSPVLAIACACIQVVALMILWPDLIREYDRWRRDDDDA